MDITKIKFLQNEASSGDDVSAGSAQTTDNSTVTESTGGSDTTKESSNQKDYDYVKAALDKITGSYNEVNQKVTKYDAKMDLLEKLESVFTPKQEKNVFNPDAINAQNVADAAKHLAKTGELTQKELSELKQSIAELQNYKTVNEYQSAKSNMDSFWTSNVFGDEKSYLAALDEIGERNPQIIKDLEDIQSSGRAPGTDFLTKIHGAVKDYVLAELLNPDSKVSKSIYSKINQKEKLSRNSTFDGDGFKSGQDQPSGDLVVNSVRYY